MLRASARTEGEVGPPPRSSSSPEGATVFASAGSAAAGFADAAPSSSSAMGVFTGTVCCSDARSRVTRPDAGDGTSVSALSVDTVTST
ncbi:MAG: hypothetical protein R3A52_28815 [Polyangiales bacterium]